MVRKNLSELRQEWGWTPSDLITLLRGGGNSKKGGAYEREICGKLSRWWSDGARDDLFWRSAASGGRATVRGKRGLQTAGHYGDIAATDPSGEDLTRHLCIEIKRGYSEYTIHDLVDRPRGAAVQVWEGFFSQAAAAAKAASAYSWIVINKRDRRTPTIWCPLHLVRALAPPGTTTRFAGPLSLLPGIKAAIYTSEGLVCGWLLDEWLAQTSPKQVRGLPSA